MLRFCVITPLLWEQKGKKNMILLDLVVGRYLHLNYFNDCECHRIKYVACNHDFLVCETPDGNNDMVYSIKRRTHESYRHYGLWTEDVFVCQKMEDNFPLYLTLDAKDIRYSDFLTTKLLFTPVVAAFEKLSNQLHSIVGSYWADTFISTLSNHGYFVDIPALNIHLIPAESDAFPLWTVNDLMNRVINGSWAVSREMAEDICELFWKYYSSVCFDEGLVLCQKGP